MANPMIEKRTWKEFKATGMLWLANRILHLYGWAIILEIDEGKVVKAYPARVKFRGFDEKSETKGFKAVANFITQNAVILEEEANS